MPSPEGARHYPPPTPEQSGGLDDLINAEAKRIGVANDNAEGSAPIDLERTPPSIEATDVDAAFDAIRQPGSSLEEVVETEAAKSGAAAVEGSEPVSLEAPTETAEGSRDRFLRDMQSFKGAGAEDAARSHAEASKIADARRTAEALAQTMYPETPNSTSGDYASIRIEAPQESARGRDRAKPEREGEQGPADIDPEAQRKRAFSEISAVDDPRFEAITRLLTPAEKNEYGTLTARLIGETANKIYEAKEAGRTMAGTETLGYLRADELRALLQIKQEIKNLTDSLVAEVKLRPIEGQMEIDSLEAGLAYAPPFGADGLSDTKRTAAEIADIKAGNGSAEFFALEGSLPDEEIQRHEDLTELYTKNVVAARVRARALHTAATEAGGRRRDIDEFVSAEDKTKLLAIVQEIRRYEQTLLNKHRPGQRLPPTNLERTIAEQSKPEAQKAHENTSEEFTRESTDEKGTAQIRKGPNRAKKPGGLLKRISGFFGRGSSE